MKAVLAILLAAVVCACVADQFYCGRELASTLARFCDNLVKRSPWLAKSVARGFRSRRQVVSECCEKPCTMSELLSYCAN